MPGQGLWGLVLVFFLGVGGCSANGGSEAGNPSRSVVGMLSPISQTASLEVDEAFSCPADTVVAIDSRLQERPFSVQADNCSFSLELFNNEAYAIRFRLGDLDVGSMIFQNSPDRFPSPVMELSQESSEIALGEIEIDDGQSKPENEPAAQNDADQDGEPDLMDVDDDNDGILDVDEPDCDLDGILDDYDDQNTDCSIPQLPPANTVLEVLPRNGAGTTTPEDAVLFDRPVEARFSCEIDPQSLNPETLMIAAKDAPGTLLRCAFTLSEGGTMASCIPQDLVPDTTYETTIQSVRCKDGSSIASTTWGWRTISLTPESVAPQEPEKIPGQ